MWHTSVHLFAVPFCHDSISLVASTAFLYRWPLSSNKMQVKNIIYKPVLCIIHQLWERFQYSGKGSFYKCCRIYEQIKVTFSPKYWRIHIKGNLPERWQKDQTKAKRRKAEMETQANIALKQSCFPAHPPCCIFANTPSWQPSILFCDTLHHLF